MRAPYGGAMRILVTNDDGIDSIGLHVLARALKQHGEVVVVAPDSEYSGASAAFGALHLIRPELHRAHIDGIDEAWAITGPPALCVLMVREGAIPGPFDLIVSGINPGANVGRAVYHSGTIGAAITARHGGINGIAVSQAVTMGGVEGQAWDTMLEGQRWEVAAEIASICAGAMIEHPPEPAQTLNLNVPNLPLDEIKGWKETTIGMMPTRSMGRVRAEPKIGFEDVYELHLEWGVARDDLPIESDVGAVMAGYVSTTWLSRIEPIAPPAPRAIETALDQLWD